MDFTIIVAMDKNRSIGYENKIQWNLQPDMEFFKQITSKPKSAVIMGRNTYNSIGRALPNRINIVLSKTLTSLPDKNIIVLKKFEDSLNYCYKHDNIRNVFVIGGGVLYNEAIYHEFCEKIYVTEIYETFKGDTFFPKINSDYFRLGWTSGIKNYNNMDYIIKEYISRR